jgi:hypothetical protein
MARDDFQLAADLAKAPYSLGEWMSIGQSGRATAIYRELRAIDIQTYPPGDRRLADASGALI